VGLKEGKALLERRKLLKELFLGDLLFRETALAFDVSVEKTFHDDTPLYRIEPCAYTSRQTELCTPGCIARLSQAVTVTRLRGG